MTLLVLVVVVLAGERKRGGKVGEETARLMCGMRGDGRGDISFGVFFSRKVRIKIIKKRIEHNVEQVLYFPTRW